ncbi:unnamed protein product [Caenorhabditis bovis]|uniref:Uncharacterized protein n=1 Tax=Caenorhabditis bovis TaxID=2654633 RepID=A0A8S1EFQ3_9PELO|nr:unnamed protein product [Caenorhabditis bovis]
MLHLLSSNFRQVSPPLSKTQHWNNCNCLQHVISRQKKPNTKKTFKLVTASFPSIQLISSLIGDELLPLNAYSYSSLSDLIYDHGDDEDSEDDDDNVFLTTEHMILQNEINAKLDHSLKREQWKFDLVQILSAVRDTSNYREMLERKSLTELILTYNRTFDKSSIWNPETSTRFVPVFGSWVPPSKLQLTTDGPLPTNHPLFSETFFPDESPRSDHLEL